MPNIFYTYSDINYLCRALALYNAIVRHVDDGWLYFLCLDKLSYDILNNAKFPRICVISVQELEKYDEALASIKSKRTQIEFYFSCTASFGRYIFAHFNNVHFLTYLDADTYFYSSPKAVLDQIERFSIAITPHRFPLSKKHNEKYGVYNVGWVSFKRDEEGLACLEKWRDDCLQWCGNYLDDDRFGDQKYLDKWPNLFKNVHIIEHNGVNAAPWNLEGALVSEKVGKLYINNDPLILYHFHSLSRLIWQIYNLGLWDYAVYKNPIIWQKMYLPYIQEVNANYRILQENTLPRYGIGRKSFSLRNFLRSKDLLINFMG